MQFNSFIYILVLLPLVVFAYYGANRINLQLGKFVLLAASILFYTYTGVSALLPLGISLSVNFLFSCVIAKASKWRPVYLFIPILVNIGVLFYFKYLNFAILGFNEVFAKQIPLKELVLPLGISFFTFQQIAYLVAVYQGELTENHLTDYLVFILYFPKILMGPLTDPLVFISQINDGNTKRVNWDNLAAGIKLFSLGLFKKTMLADVFAKAVAWGYSNVETASSMDWVLIILFYTFQIYFDFSGYSDMAVGSSLLLNITLPINFDSPYKAISVRDFWKRWHISLTQFFTKYLYIPLGGNRKGAFLTGVNIMIVFSLSGIWHGANWTFILWGVIYGMLSIWERLSEKQIKKIFLPLRWVGTFLIVNILWLLFRSDSIGQWWEILTKATRFWHSAISGEVFRIFQIPEIAFISDVLRIQWLAEKIPGFWMYAYIAISFLICFMWDNHYKRKEEKSWVMMVVSAIAFIWGFISISGESVFVYFNF